jgi:RNA polymerase sigma factor (sigma-70 family)
MRDYRRREKRRRRHVPDRALYRGPRGETVEDARQRDKGSADLYAALHHGQAQLDVRDRRLIELKFWHDTPLAEIARQMGLGSRRKVEQELKRVLNRLHVLMFKKLAESIFNPHKDLGFLGAD